MAALGEGDVAVGYDVRLAAVRELVLVLVHRLTGATEGLMGPVPALVMLGRWLMNPRPALVMLGWWFMYLRLTLVALGRWFMDLSRRLAMLRWFVGTEDVARTALVGAMATSGIMLIQRTL